MIKESSPIAHLLTMVRPANSEARTKYLLQLCWDLAYSHGVKMTEQAHSILDEPEFKLTGLLKIPIETKLPELTPFLTERIWQNRKLQHVGDKPYVFINTHHQLAEAASKHAFSSRNFRKK